MRWLLARGVTDLSGPRSGVLLLGNQEIGGEVTLPALLTTPEQSINRRFSLPGTDRHGFVVGGETAVMGNQVPLCHRRDVAGKPGGRPHRTRPIPLIAKCGFGLFPRRWLWSGRMHWRALSQVGGDYERHAITLSSYRCLPACHLTYWATNEL